MALYHEGMSEMLARVEMMTESECLQTLDSLFGRDNLKYGDDLEALRNETRRQIREEFKNTSDPAWDQVNFWKSVHKAGGFSA